MLLTKQSDIGGQRNMPVAVLNDSSLVTTVTNETVAMYYYNAGVLTVDAGSAAGTLILGKLAYGPVLDDIGSKVANKDNKSLAFTYDAFTNERVFDWTKLEQSFDTTGEILLENVCTGFAEGDYAIDYRTGTIYGKKATITSEISVQTYKIPGKAPVSVSLAPGDVEIGAVEIKDAGSDERAKVSSTGADAGSNTQNQIEVNSRLSGFNGTTWDRIRTAIVAATSTLTGILAL